MRLFVLSRKEYAGGEVTYEMLAKNTSQTVINMQLTVKNPKDFPRTEYFPVEFILGREYNLELTLVDKEA